MVIRTYFDLVFRTSQVVRPVFKGGRDGQKFLLVDYVVSFSQGEFL
jgi:hypothetical protein